MALYKVSSKVTGTWGNVRLEKGMSVEVVIQGSTSSMESIKKVKDAFMDKYNVDIQSMYSSSYMVYEKI